MQSDLLSGAMWYGTFLFSTTCHEAAHAWTALRLGDDTAAKGGQVSLNPMPHVRREPLGMVVVPVLSWLLGGWIVGWASAPYSVAWARQYPRRAALMALAGPGTNLVLAVLAGLLIRVGYEWDFFSAPHTLATARMAVGSDGGSADLLARLLSIFLSLNLILCVFNLIPLPPLDGSSIPLLLLPPAAADKYSAMLRHPILSYAGILLASRLITPIVPKLLLGAASLLYPAMHYF